jgi:hypothetical protein
MSNEIGWGYDEGNHVYLANTRIDGVTARATVSPERSGESAYWTVWAFCANWKHDARHIRQGDRKIPRAGIGPVLNFGLTQLLRISREAAACLAKHPGEVAG